MRSLATDGTELNGTQNLTFSPIHTHGRKTRKLCSIVFRSSDGRTITAPDGTCHRQNVRARAVGYASAAGPCHRGLAVGSRIRGGTMHGAGGTAIAVGCTG